MNFLLFLPLIVYQLITNSFNNVDTAEFIANKNSIINSYKLYNAERDLGVKAATLEVSENGFVRYKKILDKGKIEYYSFRVDNIGEVNYLGSEKAGWLIINCKEESVIFQTYHDIKGDIDEMVNQIKIPLKEINIENINKLSLNFNNLKASFYKNTQN